MNRTFFIAILLTCYVNAADWLMLQGTQKRLGHTPWGFVQIRGEHNTGKEVIKNGINKTPFSFIKPNLEQQTEVQIARARVGLRGSLDEENKINYFILTEFAENGVNNPLGHHRDTYLTDASITFKHLPIFIRVGKFKYAGSEEGFMARFVSPFINFTTSSDQLLLERFVDNRLSAPTQGVGAYRDSGIQLFKTLEITEHSTLSLSYMIGNGSGMQNYNINANNFTHYGYIAYENILGKGKAYRQESLKFYTWLQDGKRKLNINNKDELYDRLRYGVGLTYFNHGLHIESEYVAGRGMIFNGAKDIDSSAVNEFWVYAMNPEFENRADGYHIASTYAIFEPFEAVARYDVYNRMINSDSEYRKFESFTSGFSYRFKNYDRIDFNYAINSIKAVDNSAADDLLKSSVGNLFSIQLTMVF
ncbi:hypothetical protein GJV85_08000 [Sulfurimonas aquatica]|uniref:Porin n=1 Tax=Sulfurimonas aquatica TaxID=2672570 RepID=A0A975GD86_9BACT|nr:hypothetical protein [Sulfurimonas aquatica]QSZ42054.1 hypothetical protein GJV85_08000 [Sulfurimonas aquatica]